MKISRLKQQNLQLREWTTKRKAPKFEMIKFTKNREFAYLSPKWVKEKQIKVKNIVGNEIPHEKQDKRHMRFHRVGHLDFFMVRQLKIFEVDTIMNLYYNLCIFEGGIDRITCDYKIRPAEVSEWKKNYDKRIVGCDWAIDIDCGSHEDISYARDSTLMIAEFFDKCKVPYELRFSGMGFHIVVPWDYVCLFKKRLDPKHKDNLWRFLKSITEKISKRFSQMVDLTIYDSRRVLKLPYSLAFYEDETYVCLPLLSLQELKEFTLTNYTFKNIDAESLRGRDTKVFNYSLQYNTKLLYEELEVDF